MTKHKSNQIIQILRLLTVRKIKIERILSWTSQPRFRIDHQMFHSLIQCWSIHQSLKIPNIDCQNNLLERKMMNWRSSNFTMESQILNFRNCLASSLNIRLKLRLCWFLRKMSQIDSKVERVQHLSNKITLQIVLHSLVNPNLNMILTLVMNLVLALLSERAQILKERKLKRLLTQTTLRMS